MRQGGIEPDTWCLIMAHVGRSAWDALHQRAEKCLRGGNSRSMLGRRHGERTLTKGEPRQWWLGGKPGTWWGVLKPAHVVGAQGHNRTGISSRKGSGRRKASSWRIEGWLGQGTTRASVAQIRSRPPCPQSPPRCKQKPHFRRRHGGPPSRTLPSWAWNLPCGVA
jgi:hypothetical protein